MRLRPLVLGTVLAAGAAQTAWAQGQPQVPAVEAKREYDVGLRLAVFHETNVAKASAATAAARGIVQEDQYFRPQLTASVVQPLGQQALFLRGAAGYDFYNRNEQLDRQRYDFTGGHMARLGACREVAFGTFREQQSELTELDVLTVENRQRVTAVGLALDCGRATGLRGGVVLQRQQAKNSATTRRTSDADNQVAMVTLGYSRPSLGTLTLIYNYSDAQFPNRIIPGRPVGDGFFTETFGVGAERRFGSRLVVGGTVARTELKREFTPPELNLRSKLSVTSYSANVSYRPGTRMEVTLSGRRDVKPSERTGKLYDIAEQLDGSIRYRLGTRFTVAAGHTYSDVVSNVDTSTNVNVLTSSITNATSASIQYRQSARASLIFDVRREDRKTNLPAFDYKDTRVGLTAEYSFF